MLGPPLARPGADEELLHGTPTQPYLPSRSIASAYGPAGAVAGDAESVARWGYALYGARLLKPDSVAQMTDFKDGDGYGLGRMDFSSGRFSSSTQEAVGHLGILARVPHGARRVSRRARIRRHPHPVHR